jgi:hypothetical protein
LILQGIESCVNFSKHNETGVTFCQKFATIFFSMIYLTEQTQKIGLAVWFICTLISASIYLGGVSDQLTFGSSVCLLFIENYHLNESLKVYLFDAISPSCGTSISMGTIGLLLLFAIVGVRGYLLYKQEEPSRTLLLSLASVASLWAFIMIIMASILTAGVDKTCSEFRKSTKSCGVVFGEGFFADTTKTVYYKNINTVNATVGASWVTFIFWVVYASFEWYSYRHASLKWW